MPKSFGLNISDLRKEFDTIVALDSINMSIRSGTIVGLLGQNGAGKSTLVRLLSGVMRPTSGTATVAGFDLVQDTDKVKRLTGLLPEEYALYEKLSVFEYIEFIATLYDMEEEIIEKRFIQLVTRLEALELRNRLIETLSKGQKQKIALIAALIHEPQLLFLDEPMANLDVSAQRIVRDIIREYKAKDRIIMIATHLMSNVEATCDEVVIIDKGNIKFSGSIMEFQQNKQDLEEAYLAFVSEIGRK